MSIAIFETAGGVRYIGSNAFAGNETTLASVTVAAGVTYIGEKAFGGGSPYSSNLLKMSVTFPSTLTTINKSPIPPAEGSSFVLQSTVKNEGDESWGVSDAVSAEMLEAGRYTYSRRSDGWVYSAK